MLMYNATQQGHLSETLGLAKETLMKTLTVKQRENLSRKAYTKQSKSNFVTCYSRSIRRNHKLNCSSKRSKNATNNLKRKRAS